MVKKLIKGLLKEAKESKYLLLLLLTIFAIWITNYVPDTFLIGWDNLYPELNFAHNFKMNFFSVWQEYRGLGVEDGLAHAANIVHTTFLFLLNFFMPLEFLRYFFNFFMLGLGGLGVYFLLYRQFNKKQPLAFIGALCYMLNPATVQMFFAPLEVFSTHFAALPWMVYVLLNYLKKPDKKHLIALFLSSLLFTPQGFVPTVFIAYIVVVSSILFTFFLQKKSRAIKQIVIVVAVILCSNAFWLLPFTHGAITQGKTIKNTKINQISSEEIFAKNKKRGTLFDVLYLRGFMLDITESDINGRLAFIMQPWKDHQNTPIYFLLFSSVVGLVLLGLGKSLVKSKNIYEKGFVLIFAVGLFMLGSSIPLIGGINAYLRENIPLFGEAFRFPFTKFAILFVFAYTFFFIRGLEIILNKLKHIRVIMLLTAGIVFYLSFPVFQGHFFYSMERLKVPNDYLKLINYFKAENNTKRVMTLPQPSYTNWLFYSWGGRGSGFWWYGLKNPTLERPFDPWSDYNGQYFNELYYSLQLNDKQLFKNTVDKYDVGYIVVDGYFLTNNKTQRDYKMSSLIEAVFPFSEKMQYGKLVVYKLKDSDSAISLTKNTTAIDSNFASEFIDTIFNDFGDYYQDDSWQVASLLPSLFTNKTQSSLEFDYELEENFITFTPRKPINFKEGEQYYLEIPTFTQKENLVPVKFIMLKNEVSLEPLVAQVQINNRAYPLILYNKQTFKLSSEVKKVTFNGAELELNGSEFIFAYTNHTNSIIFELHNGREVVYEYNVGKFLDTSFLQIMNPEKPSKVKVTVPLLFLASFIDQPVLDNAFTEEVPCSDDLGMMHNGKSFIERSGNKINLITEGSSACVHKYVPNVYQAFGTLISLNVIKETGLPLRVVVDNPVQETNFIDTKLDGSSSRKLLILPPTTENLYTDYGLHLRNVSFNKEPSINSIGDTNFSYIPYNWLRSIQIKKTGSNDTNLEKENLNVKHTFPYLYQTNIGIGNTSSIISLSQAFNDGWKAYSIKKPGVLATFLPFFFGTELKDHVLVNNWANGWQLPEGLTGEMVIVFWPQYLQFIGFGLLALAFIGVLFYKNKKTNNHTKLNLKQIIKKQQKKLNKLKKGVKTEYKVIKEEVNKLEGKTEEIFSFEREKGPIPQNPPTPHPVSDKPSLNTKPKAKTKPQQDPSNQNNSSNPLNVADLV